MVSIDNTVEPYALFDQYKAENTLDYIRAKNGSVKVKYSHIGKTAEDKSQGDIYNPHEAAVEKEGDKRFASRTQSEISCVSACLHRHKNCRSNYQRCCNVSYCVFGVIYFREERCK